MRRRYRARASAFSCVAPPGPVGADVSPNTLYVSVQFLLLVPEFTAAPQRRPLPLLSKAQSRDAYVVNDIHSNDNTKQYVYTPQLNMAKSFVNLFMDE